MARFYECSGCEHAQLVGVIDNGLPAGYADPHAHCENCGAVGKFHFVPGAARSLRDSIANARLVEPPDPAAFEQLDRLMKGIEDTSAFDRP